MCHLRSLPLLLTVSAIASFVACSSDQSPSSPITTTPSVVGIPELSSQQKADARAIFASDQRAQQLLAGHAYTIPDDQIGPWYDTDTGYLYGAGMGVAIAQPFYAEFDWPVLGPGDPYGETTQAYGAEVAHLFVLIDLNSGKMVSMAPDDESTTYPHRGESIE